MTETNNEAEQRWRLAIEAARMAWNLETNQVCWNEQHFRLFGLQPQPNPIRPDDFCAHVRAIRMNGVMFDIMDRKVAEDRLRESNRRKDEFLAMLAHELRNPMAPIDNGLQILSLTAESSSYSGPLVSLMSGQVDQLVRLVDDLLDVSRIS